MPCPSRCAELNGATPARKLSLHDPHEQDFDRYVARKRVDGVFGNNLEMQAMAELYNRPIEVCAVFSSTPGPRCS